MGTNSTDTVLVQPRRRSFKSRLINFLGYHLTPLVLRFFVWSYRVKIILGEEHLAAAKAHHPKGSYSLAIWHHDAFGGTLGHAFQNICMLISHSDDGAITSHAVGEIGFQTVRGSSSKGGKEAKDELVTRMQEECLVLGITVDGPRGPLHQVKPGIISIASKTGTPILPMSAYAPSSWVLTSWDKLRIPKPFAKVYIGYGPIHLVPSQLTLEQSDQERVVVGDKITQLCTQLKAKVEAL